MRDVHFEPRALTPPSGATIIGASAVWAQVSFTTPHVSFTPQVALSAPRYAPTSISPPASSASAITGETGGPNPYVDYARRYTPEDGIAFTYKTIDESSWRTVTRTLGLAFLVTMVFAYQVDASPYPVLPPGCRPLGPCPVAVPLGPLTVNLLLLAAFGLACAWILFTEVQVYREVEIRPDSMILDGAEVFWAEKFELEWPKFTAGEGDMRVLAGVYGTRYTEFFKLKAFDENDRVPQVFAKQLAEAMQQQWAQT